MLPALPGVGFKPEHFAAICQTAGGVGFFEIHAENYLGAGGLPHAQLAAIRADFPVSIHGVGLSIGAANGVDAAHLDRVRRLCERYEPQSFSEHLAWSSHGAEYLNDLLPLPYTEETLTIVCDHIDRVQEVLGRRMLLENPATYLCFANSLIPETEFLSEVALRTGCGLLLDVNNVFVSCINHGTDPYAWLAALPLDLVGEVHLGGHDADEMPTGSLLIDSHAAPVADPVWALFAEVIMRAGPLPTLIEWDNDLPEWSVLCAEAARAGAILARGGNGFAHAC